MFGAIAMGVREGGFVGLPVAKQFEFDCLQTLHRDTYS